MFLTLLRLIKWDLIITREMKTNLKVKQNIRFE